MLEKLVQDEYDQNTLYKSIKILNKFIIKILSPMIWTFCEPIYKNNSLKNWLFHHSNYKRKQSYKI